MRKDFIIKNIIKVFPSKLINLQQYYLIKYSNGRVKLEPILWSEIELEVKILYMLIEYAIKKKKKKRLVV